MFGTSPIVALVVLCCISFAWFEYVAITQFLSGHWFLVDVGGLNYCLYNTLHGRFMWSPATETNHFAYHFTPFLLLLLPLVPLSAYPIPFVTAHMAAIAACAVPVYFLARRVGLPVSLALSAAALFLANYYLGGIELSNHFEIFLVLFLLCVMATVELRTPWVWLFVCLALSVKEDAPVLLGVYAFYVALSPGEAWLRRRGWQILALSAAYLVCALAIELTVARSQPHNATFYLQRLQDVRLRPELGVRLLQLLGSFGFLSLFSGWQLLLPLAPAPLLLAGFSATFDLQYHYGYPFLPFLALSGITGLAFLFRWMQKHDIAPPRASAFCCIFLLGLAAIQFPMRTGTDGLRRLPFPITERAQYRLQVLRDVLPPGVPTAIQPPLFCMVPNRPDARALSDANAAAQRYAVFDLTAPMGIPKEEFVRVTKRLLQEVDDGKRRALHRAHDLFIIGPALAPP